MFRPAVLVSAVLLLVLLVPTPATAAPDLLLVLDASGSMWGQIDGENKIVIARRVVKELAGGLADDAEVGLIAYGHRREGDCSDVEVVMPIAALDRSVLGTTVDGLNPKGKTPITASLEQAFEVAKARQAPTTVVLVSDGLETCDGDPCAAVRAAKEAGVDFIMHVVGFDVGKEDVSSLECAAQAGGGLFRSAESADELAGALEQAVAMPADDPPGTLSVKVVADGELQDAMVRVETADTGEEVEYGRTYTAPETNPRVLPVANGSYNVSVKALGLRGEVERRLEGIEIAGEMKEIEVDFSSGDLVVKVMRNDTLGDATIRVYYAGTNQQAASGRSYTSPDSNPATYRLTAGTYDVVVSSVEIANRPERRFEGVVVEPGGRLELEHIFASGTLKVGSVNGAERVDTIVKVVAADGKPVTQGRTYTAETSNPKTFVLTPGTYEIQVKGFKDVDNQQREIEVTIEVGGDAEHTIDFSS